MKRSPRHTTKVPGAFLFEEDFVNIGRPTAGSQVSKTSVSGSTPLRPGFRWRVVQLEEHEIPDLKVASSTLALPISLPRSSDGENRDLLNRIPGFEARRGDLTDNLRYHNIWLCTKIERRTTPTCETISSVDTLGVGRRLRKCSAGNAPDADRGKSWSSIISIRRRNR